MTSLEDSEKGTEETKSIDEETLRSFALEFEQERAGCSALEFASYIKYATSNEERTLYQIYLATRPLGFQQQVRTHLEDPFLKLKSLFE